VLGVGEIEASRAPIIVTNAEGQPIVAIIPFDLLRAAGVTVSGRRA
jgi:hypothetical protein